MRADRGFALIDSVVALAIVGMSLPVLLLSLQAASRREIDDQTRSTLVEIADRILTEAALVPPGASEGREGQITWRVRSGRVPTASDGSDARGPSLIDLVVEVSLDGMTGTGHTVRLETLVLETQP